MELYKYAGLDRFDILRTSLIRYSQPSAFNDPFEMPAFLEKIITDEEMEIKLEKEFIPEVLNQDIDNFSTEGKLVVPFSYILERKDELF